MFTQNPFDPSKGTQVTLTRGTIDQPQTDMLEWLDGIDPDMELTGNALVAGHEDAVTKAMTHDSMRLPHQRSRHRRPAGAGFLIPQIKRLAVGVGYRIAVPGR